MRKKFTDDKGDKVIDLLSLQKEAQDESKTYICSVCGNDLVHDRTYRLRNPYGGEGYFCSNINKCPSFAKIIDISLVKPKVRPRPVKGAVSNIKDANQEVMIDFISEDKGLTFEKDDYDKYNELLEPNEDETLKAQGFHITSSEIQLTDSSGNNRTVVKRTSS